eukprot:scaffold147615_cov14-Prasinocladus_malaysianus.AAC.1
MQHRITRCHRPRHLCIWALLDDDSRQAFNFLAVICVLSGDSNRIASQVKEYAMSYGNPKVFVLDSLLNDSRVCG